MSDQVLTLSPELKERLEALAPKIGRSLEDCINVALGEFLDTWEDHLRTIDELQSPEDRPVLRAVND
jgi:predicted DNA-binding protein